MTYLEKTFHVLVLSITLSFWSAVAFAQDADIQDHYKNVIIKHPYSVEVCEQGNGKSDLDNFLTGAIVGGAIGNNIPGEKNGGAAGAILGGILNTERNKSPQCRIETRYEEELKSVYSHSTITFWYEGKRKTLSFNK